MAPVTLSVPHIPQREQGECLAACAAMMVQYAGLEINYDQLLKLLQVRTSIGAPAANIHQLESLGLSVVYEHGGWQDLEDHLANSRPCMALVQTAELPYWAERSNHAVVIVGLDKQFIYLNDSAFPAAPIQVPRDEFDLAWLERDEVYATIVV